MYRRFVNIALFMTFAVLPSRGQSKGFTVYINSGGWAVPTLSKELGRSTTPSNGAEPNITVIHYKSEGSFFLPRYFVNEDGSLVAQSISFYADEVEIIQIDGYIVEYDALVKGNQIGIVSHVSWRDADGHGIFTALRWGARERALPHWVKDEEKNSCKIANLSK